MRIIIIIIVEIVMIMIKKNNNNIYIYVCVIWNLELYSKKNMQGNSATLAMGLNQLYEMMG